MPILYQTAEKPSGLREDTKSIKIIELEKKLETLKDEVKGNPREVAKLEEIRKTKEEILSLRRELNRAKRYTEISRKELANGSADLDNIPATNLMRLDRDAKTERRGEFLSKAYLYKRVTEENGNITEEPSDGKSLKEGDTLYVDLGKDTGKKSAYWKIGLGDMLSADVGYVKVNGVIGMRSIINGRVGYYTKPSPDGYIAVFSGNNVTIPTASEISVFTNAKPLKLERNMSQEESDKAFDMRIEKLERSPESSNIDISTNMRESYDFWKSKGFSEEQTAGLLANEYQESKCNPTALGDKDDATGIYKAKGIFQWHPNRREAILNGTGINIDTATHKQQLDAAWWEMTQESFEKKVYPLLKNAKTSREAAGIISSEYLRPKDSTGEPKVRGEMAENIFNQFRFINNPELANIAEGPANKAIVKMALELEKTGDNLGAEHCTDWVDKIYFNTIGRSVYSTKPYYNGIEKINVGTKLGGNPADQSNISGIKPGMHIIVDKPNDAGAYNQGKTHSVIALSTPINGIGKVVSYPNGKIPPKIEMYDFYGQGRGEKDGKPLRIQGV